MLVSAGMTLLKRAGFDDNDPLLAWMNAGLHVFERAHPWPFLETFALVPVVAGNSTIVVPATFGKVQSIRSTTGTILKLRYYNNSKFEREIENPSLTGVPQVYRFLGTGSNGIQLWPVPLVDTSFLVLYQSKLVEMVSTSVEMPGPTDIHYLIVQAAKYIALQDENEEDRAVTAQAQFTAAVEELWDSYSTTEEDEPDQVTDVMGYGC